MAIVNTSAIQAGLAAKVQCFDSAGRFADGGLWTDTDDSVNDSGVVVEGNQIISHDIIQGKPDYGGGLKKTRSQYGK
jgi:hypothetical protein